jgi:hypothetical protein
MKFSNATYDILAKVFNLVPYAGLALLFGYGLHLLVGALAKGMVR